LRLSSSQIEKAGLPTLNGSMNTDDHTNTRRRSLWRGVNLQRSRAGAKHDDEASNDANADDDYAVRTLDG